jgi:hypothetical protein
MHKKIQNGLFGRCLHCTDQPLIPWGNSMNPEDECSLNLYCPGCRD